MSDAVISIDENGQTVLRPECLETSSDRPSVLALSLPKAGSVLLDGIMKMLCERCGLTYVSIMEAFFQVGVIETDIPSETSQLFRESGFCYGGFRYYPTQFDIPISNTAPAILLVRDPRDMLVSLYFSALKSHPKRGRDGANPASEAAAEMNIENYVKRFAKMYKMRMKDYCVFLDRRPDTKVFRYEDIIYDKVAWVGDICSHFQWGIPEEDQANIANHWNIIPDAEQPDAHVRQVHPGNYLNKLTPETINWLNDFLGDEMVAFGYK